MARKVKARREWGSLYPTISKNRLDRDGNPQQIGWTAAYTSPIVGEGKITKKFKLDAKMMAEAWLDKEEAYVREVEKGLHPYYRPKVREQQRQTSTVTLGQYAAQWLEEYRNPTTRKRPKKATLYQYGIYLQYCVESLGADTQLRKITPAMVEHMLLDVREKHGECAPHKTFVALKLCLKCACIPSTDGVALLDSNPCANIPVPRLPKSRQAQIPEATPQQVKAIYENLPADCRLSVYISTMCGGLRISEVLALQVKDVDLKNKTLHVRHGLEFGRAGKLQAPKTDSSVRDYPIPDVLLPLLRDHIRDHTDHADPDAFLFKGRMGGGMGTTTLRRRFKRACTAIGRPDLHFHTLRATYTTWLMLSAQKNGATVTDLKSLAGRDDLSTMDTIYGRSTAERRNDIAEGVASIGFGTEEESEAQPKTLEEALRIIEQLKAARG